MLLVAVILSDVKAPFVITRPGIAAVEPMAGVPNTPRMSRWLLALGSPTLNSAKPVATALPVSAPDVDFSAAWFTAKLKLVPAVAVTWWAPFKKGLLRPETVTQSPTAK